MCANLLALQNNGKDDHDVKTIQSLFSFGEEQSGSLILLKNEYSSDAMIELLHHIHFMDIVNHLKVATNERNFNETITILLGMLEIALWTYQNDTKESHNETCDFLANKENITEIIQTVEGKNPALQIIIGYFVWIDTILKRCKEVFPSCFKLPAKLLSYIFLEQAEKLKDLVVESIFAQESLPAVFDSIFRYVQGLFLLYFFLGADR